MVAVAALAEVLGLTVVLNLYGVYFSPFARWIAALVGRVLAGGILYGRSTSAGQRKHTLEEVFGESHLPRDLQQAA